MKRTAIFLTLMFILTLSITFAEYDKLTASDMMISDSQNLFMQENRGSHYWDTGIGNPGMDDDYCYVFALTIYNGDLIAAGQFWTAGGISVDEFAKWDGASWSGLGNYGSDGMVRALTVYNDDLIAGGYFQNLNGMAVNGIAKYDGASWSALSTGMGTTNPYVRALTVYDGYLIAGGTFTASGGAAGDRIAKWNGTSWSALGSGMNSTVYSLTVYDGCLYAGGTFTTAGGVTVNRIARWDGTSWSALGSGMNSTVYSLTVYDGCLVAGGSFTTAGGVTVNNIAKWDGSSWSAMGSGISASSEVYALKFIGNDLYAGGTFINAGSVTVNRIAKWDGSSWSALGSGMNSTVAALENYNGSLIAGGHFTTAGGITSNHIARWYYRDSAAISLENASLEGIWQWDYDPSRSPYIESKGSSWSKILSGVSATRILAGDISDDGNLELVALFPDMGLYYYDIAGALWTNIICSTAGCTDFTIARTSSDGPVEVVATFEETGIQKWTFQDAWTVINSMSADLLIASDINRDENSIDELVLALTGYEGFLIYDFATEQFSSIINISPSQVVPADVTGDGYDELISVFDGFGIYLVRYLPEKGLDIKTASEIDPAFDLISDITENSIWVSKDRCSRGFQFNRLTCGSPAAGHFAAAGDITGDSGAEVIFTYTDGKTYYYEYEAKGWATLVMASLKRITSGRFTGGARDDLIACETSTGNIYLRVTSTETWENIAAYGDTNAMTAY